MLLFYWDDQTFQFTQTVPVLTSLSNVPVNFSKTVDLSQFYTHSVQSVSFWPVWTQLCLKMNVFGSPEYQLQSEHSLKSLSSVACFKTFNICTIPHWKDLSFKIWSAYAISRVRLICFLFFVSKFDLMGQFSKALSSEKWLFTMLSCQRFASLLILCGSLSKTEDKAFDMHRSWLNT